MIDASELQQILNFLSPSSAEIVRGVIAELAKAKAEVEKLKATIEPVRSWYDGDGRLTDVVDMLTSAIADLQEDRAAVLKLETALRSISHVDKTPMYGCKGTRADRNRYGQLPKKSGERWKTPREIVRDTLGGEL